MNNNKPIRILQYIGSLNVGGSQVMIMELYRKIDKTKVQFDFIVDKKGELYFAEEIKKMGGRIYEMNNYKIFNHYNFCYQLDAFFKEHKEYHVIHCHLKSIASIVLKIAKKNNLITICHSHSTSNGSGIKSIIKGIYQKNIPLYSDYLFACSKDSARWVYGEKCANSDNCIIINNAIDSSKYIYNSKTREKKRKELGVDNKIVIVQVGRIEAIKNHLFTLDVLKKCVEINNKFYLLIIGDGSIKKDICNKIDEYGLNKYVSLLGNRNDINEILQASDIFIMPSYSEGLPLALIEAQAASLPCVISNNITAGVLINNIVDKLDLNSPISLWVKAINRWSNYKRKNTSNIIIDSGFDVMANSRMICDFYCKLNNGDLNE